MTIKINHNSDMKVLEIILHRPEVKNAINVQLIHDVDQALGRAENGENIRTIVLRGAEDVFSSGMDLKEKSETFPAAYSALLKRLASIPKVTIAICEGKVIAGGVGLAAACDIVIASPKATFMLPELLLGILPANVLPYLIRRIGFQSSYFMTLTATTKTAQEAKEMHLVDILSDNLNEEFVKLNKHLSKINPHTLANMKSYFRKLWIIDEQTEQLGINNSLMEEFLKGT